MSVKLVSVLHVLLVSVMFRLVSVKYMIIVCRINYHWFLYQFYRLIRISGIFKDPNISKSHRGSVSPDPPRQLVAQN